MKRLIGLFLAIIAIVIASSSATAAEEKAAAKVVVYYFYGSFRCITCTNMEKYAREAAEEGFKDALASGKLEFKAVNVEERGNEHFVDDYQLYTKALILSLVEGGKEVKHKNLEKIWEYSRNKQQFMDYVIGEIDSLMKDAP